MKGADAVICAIGSSGFNPKGPQTVDYEVSTFRYVSNNCVHTLDNSFQTYMVPMHNYM